MTLGHADGRDGLYWPASSPIHRLAAEVKVAAVFGFVVIVALTPRRDVVTVVIDAALVTGVVVAAKLPVRVVLARLGVLAPTLIFVAFLPFVGEGEQTNVAGVPVSTEGLWASWAILSKALLGATAAVILTATSTLPDILVALNRLHVPRVIVSIVSFMFRYLGLLTDQLTRMRAAMVARAHDPRWLWQARPIAASAGTLFVRTYERGERIHHAMVARGFTGTLPTPAAHDAGRSDWLTAAVLPFGAILALVAGLTLT